LSGYLRRWLPRALKVAVGSRKPRCDTPQVKLTPGTDMLAEDRALPARALVRVLQRIGERDERGISTSFEGG
jgi:hypothetical protein